MAIALGWRKQFQGVANWQTVVVLPFVSNDCHVAMLHTIVLHS
jgi:hypothetical protein